jgi:Ca2+:H+ antiporter
MIARRRPITAQWTTLVPFLADVLLIFTWGRDLPTAVVALVTLVLTGAVLAAVHHAEVVAHGSVNRSATSSWPLPSRSSRSPSSSP